MSLCQFARRTARRRNHPDILLYSLRETARIRILTPDKLKIAATNKDNRFAIGCPLKLRDLLAIIVAICCQPPALIIGRLRHPDVPGACFVQHPRDVPARRGHGLSGWKWGA